MVCRCCSIQVKKMKQRLVLALFRGRCNGWRLMCHVRRCNGINSTSQRKIFCLPVLKNGTYFSDTATASALTVSQLKTLIMQLRKICNHPRTLLGSAKDSAAAAAAGAAAAAAVSSSSSSKAPMGGGGKRGERLRQELAALTGEELMQASGKLLVLDRLLERLFKLESRALIFSTFTQVMSADGH